MILWTNCICCCTVFYCYILCPLAFYNRVWQYMQAENETFNPKRENTASEQLLFESDTINTGSLLFLLFLRSPTFVFGFWFFLQRALRYKRIKPMRIMTNKLNISEAEQCLLVSWSGIQLEVKTKTLKNIVNMNAITQTAFKPSSSDIWATFLTSVSKYLPSGRANSTLEVPLGR